MKPLKNIGNPVLISNTALLNFPIRTYSLCFIDRVWRPFAASLAKVAAES